MRASAATAVTLVLIAPVRASAQTAGPRFRVSLNGGIQAGRGVVTQSFTVEKNLEPATIAVDADVARAALVDIGITSRIKGPVGVGLAVSYATRTATADVTAQIPHPFFFNRPRPVAGSTPLQRSEAAGHVDIVVGRSGRVLDVFVSGGASVFEVQQALVTDISYADVYPYDAPSFGAADKIRARATAIGFNVGADVTWKVSRHVGLGGLARFARGSKDVSVANNPTTTIDAGGLQLAAGLRIPF